MDEFGNLCGEGGARGGPDNSKIIILPQWVGFPRIRGTIWGVPIFTIIVYWGLCWVPLFWKTAIRPQ